MTEESNPVVLPEQFREPEPQKPDTIKDMEVGTMRYIFTEAIRIDSKWRCWLDPNARTSTNQYVGPICVHRVNEGYMLDRNGLAKVGQFKKGIEEKYLGFLPVSRLH